LPEVEKKPIWKAAPSREPRSFAEASPEKNYLFWQAGHSIVGLGLLSFDLTPDFSSKTWVRNRRPVLPLAQSNTISNASTAEPTARDAGNATCTPSRHFAPSM